LHLNVGYAANLEGSTLEPLLRTDQSRIINDLREYLEKKPASASTKLIVEEGMKSSLTLPLVAGGKPIGVVFFSSRQKDTYNDQHASLLRRLAGHIAISIEKTQLIAQLQQRNTELAEANQIKDRFLDKLKQEVDRQTVDLRKSEQRNRRLVNLGHIINSSLDLKQVFQQAAGEINNLINCDRVSLILIHNRDNVRHGFGIEFHAGKRWVDISATALPGSATEWVMKRRIPRVARCLDKERQFPEDEHLYDRGYRAYAYLPLVCRGESVGVLGMASREANKVDEWDLDLLSELCDQLATALDNALAYGEIARLKAQLEQQNIYLRDEIKRTHDFGNIVGESRAIHGVLRAIEQVANTDSTVLIFGETGTGKELIARAIHDLSRRKDKLLVKVNCAALAPGIITSELFGHEAGAFTGASKRRHGRFEVAQDGSIFLDEIAEIPPETQIMLLRVLQERVIERVGDNKPIEVDVRVIAATNRDLKKHVDEGHFRDDLFYRLNVFPIQVPPLRDRREDIPSLINQFIGRFSRRMDKEITRVNRRTMELLMSYHWPGNVRELENIIERAMIVSPGDTLEMDATWLSDAKTESDTRDGEIIPLAEVERQVILNALQRCGGKIYGPDGAAAKLGLKPTTLYGKMRKHRIEKQETIFG
jgi:formate hydrogenlyase transcriptional activator